MSSPLAGIARFPRVRLGHMPTPLEPAPNLGAALGIELWIKRDDCTGLALGGNKVRQLEFHFGEARARGADTVLATGAVQSNLVRIAAAAARRLGMAIHIQLEDRVDGAGELYRASGNLLLDRVLGAALHPFPGPAVPPHRGGLRVGAARDGAPFLRDRFRRRLRADGFLCAAMAAGGPVRERVFRRAAALAARPGGSGAVSPIRFLLPVAVNRGGRSACAAGMPRLSPVSLGRSGHA